MKKLLLAALLGLTIAGSLTSLYPPASYAQEQPEEPKPDKPSD